ncbi:hypothetical protein B0J18DRAFT_12246 [Chaetomium sp. MPI-SDFR-AT-0129]|nr:hypothetical protein B0J18DRAFT_12246 [Chaetomium sp. MPI-SDFR-AT-0129]
MQSTVLILLVGIAASTSAAALTPKSTSYAFKLVAKEDAGSPFDGQEVTASQNKLWLSQPMEKRDTDCGSGPVDKAPATLFLQDDELFLFGGEGKSHQQLAANVSGKEHESLKYFNNTNDGPGQDFETKGWSLKPDNQDEYLSFNEAVMLACPASDDSFTVGVYQDYDRGCFELKARVEYNYQPVSCKYSGN